VTKLQTQKNLGRIVRYEGTLGMIEGYFGQEYSVYLFRPHSGKRRVRIKSGDIKIVG